MSSKNPYSDTIESYKQSLAVDYMPAVKAMAARLKERLPAEIDFNDLVSVGFEELIKLLKRYDVSRNDNFWGFAQKRIYGSMLDFLRSLDPLSRGDRKLIKQINSEIEKTVNKYGYEPDDEELASVLNVDVSKIKKAKQADAIYSVMSIDEQLKYYDDIEKKIEQDEVIEKIEEILEKECNEKEKLIIQLYYFEELALKEISEIIGVSESRISQIHKKILEKLREKLNG